MVTKRIFVSYAREDADLCEQVTTHLGSLPEVQVWTDVTNIRAGDDWVAEINQALTSADLTVLLLSPHFLRSDFIRNHELPKVRTRHSQGLRVVPFLLRPCAWKKDHWLSTIETEMPGGEALSQLEERGESHVDAALGRLAETVFDLLERPRHPAHGYGTGGPGHQDDTSAAAELLRLTVYRHLAQEGARLADAAARRIAEITGLRGAALFEATRFCLEFYLLQAPDLSVQLVPGATASAPQGTYALRLLQELQKRQRLGFAADPIQVSASFFARAREREDDWKAYFEGLEKHSTFAIERSAISTLCKIKSIGFLAGQHLLAGLLARFDDDWEPVLRAYYMSIPSAKISTGKFETLQTSQWVCWLLWGPSIPFCTCEQWSGVCAYQYGYGDENNSLPALQVVRHGEDQADTLIAFSRAMQAEGRQASLTHLIGNLRWAPWLPVKAGGTDAGPPQDPIDPFDAFDEWDGSGPSASFSVAPAQQALYQGSSHSKRQIDGLVLQVDRIFRSSERGKEAQQNVPTYFSAYRWAIFLVALAEQEEAGPKMLFGKQYPAWPSKPAERAHVRDRQMWQDLLPVFVHANVADPHALHYQTRILADCAISQLRLVWNTRDELFRRDDVAQGIRFYMVSSFDYSGCGCPLQYPSRSPLLKLLRERLAAEPDAEFRDAVVLPSESETPESRAWGLRAYFSACHLPELVADYYAAVSEKMRGPVRPTIPPR